MLAKMSIYVVLTNNKYSKQLEGNMSSVKIIKGLPLSVLVTVSNDDEQIDLHNGEWNTVLELRYQTTSGSKPFDLTTSAAGNGYLVEISSEQTTILDHKGTGYVLVIKANKIDSSVNLRNVIPVRVVNDV
jgi:hypothetical protein